MSIYYLNNGEKGWEEDRLDWSHHKMVMPLVGNTLFPREIMEDLESKPSLAIADVCTGTGVWAVSVAEQLPNAQIRGFDIDTSKFTTNPPPHVQLQYGDVFEPFPSGLLGKFDLVHARFLVSLLRKEDWVPVARNFMTLLRPGGWILWEDSGPFEFRVLPITPGWTKYATLNWSFCNAQGMDLRMPATLTTHLEEAGFVDLMEKDYHTSPYDKLDTGTKESMVRLAYQSFLGMVASGKVEEMKTEAQAKIAANEIRKEFEQGALCFWTLNRVWGKKPAQS
ncbi:S-adenosyl-L-methionine-dependent methyltransferase [Ustulina deusta]|nr:S-adenosyl-L-methionine-dependent methyltransferase [Ustulina deusta]